MIPLAKYSRIFAPWTVPSAPRGYPYSPGATGNVVTENVLYASQDSPYSAPGDLEALVLDLFPQPGDRLEHGHLPTHRSMYTRAWRSSIPQQTQSTTEIFILMLAADEKRLPKRMYEARYAVFGDSLGSVRRPVLLSESVLGPVLSGKKRATYEWKSPHRQLASLLACDGRLLGTPRHQHHPIQASETRSDADFSHMVRGR